MTTIKRALAVAGAWGVATALQAAVIDFESDALGGKANGFSSSGHALVTFYDTVGAELDLSDYGVQGLGHALACNGDGDGSKLQMDFAAPVDYLSLMFGNDDAGWATASDRAWLAILNGGSPVATVSMAMNLDDVMNQTISYSGGPFDRALFWYGDSLGNPYTTGWNRGLIEIVDQIEYRPTGQGGTVPDAGSTALLATMAMLGLASVRRLALR